MDFKIEKKLNVKNDAHFRLVLFLMKKLLLWLYSYLFKTLKLVFCTTFGGLEWVGHSFAYDALFVFLRDVWIRTQRAAVASRRDCLRHPSPLATHLPL
jgi:hypothetical protein